jgi:hypothetical protein
MLAMLAASCLPGFEAKSEHLSRGECLACQDECDGRFCPKVCAGKTAEGDDMTCALDTDCLDNSIDPYGGMGCNAGEHGQHCRFCGFESDGVKYPPCPDSDEGASDALSSDELTSRFLQLPRMSRGECLTCLDACKDKFCPDVCAGKTAQGGDMTCELDNDCLDNALDPYGGKGCNAGEHGQHCRFCGFESDGVKYPPCSTSGHPATSPPSAKGAASSKGKAASTLTTSFLMQPSSTLSGEPTRPVLPMVLLGVGLLATVFAAGIVVGARRHGATSGLMASEAAGSWAPVAVRLSAEGDYDRFGR